MQIFKFLPMLMSPKIEKARCHLGNIGKNEAAPTPQFYKISVSESEFEDNLGF